MYWANFLHIYQPPTQKEIWIRRITEESYRKVFSGLLEIPQARLTININGVLCEFLEKYGGQDVLDNIRKLLDRGNIELTGSAKYHAFLPLLPESEIERQILLNEETLNKYFGNKWKKGGFFSPEMAYSRKVAEVAKRLGYKWIIMDELGFPENKELSRDTIYNIQGLKDFSVFFRERNFSFIILSAQVGSVPTILRYLGPRLEANEYVVTAMDGETFGHHRPGLEMLLFDLLRDERTDTVMISDLLEKFEKKEAIEPLDSTWAVTKKNMKDNNPFARWKKDDNEIQQRQWELTDLAVEAANREPVNPEVRKMLDEAAHSDQYWWASARPWWSLEMIERGAYELRNVVLKSPKATEEEKRRAEELYKEIIYTGFNWQRSGLVDAISRQEDEDIQGRLEEKEKLFITKEEYQQMIDTLQEQMKLSAKAEEFGRAAMIQERIRELKEEMKKEEAKNSKS
jgi:alpha-amylase/alpha-mannosidase (GH57 family)